jgi:MoaA/NifB/PqqE/SkfB family radical SAM enzyme
MISTKKVSFASDIIDGLKIALNNQPKAKILKKWLELSEGTISFDDFFNWVQQERQLTYLCIDTTGKCNLTCKDTCYYHPEIDTSLPTANEKQLKKAIEESLQYLNTKVIAFAGKEPFLNSKLLFNLIDFAGTLKKQGFSFLVGITTNGRNVHKYWENLEFYSDNGFLDFLDISIDSGFENQHDLFRGLNGTFNLAKDALIQAKSRLKRTGVSSCSILRPDNYDGVILLIKEFSSFNKNFVITPIVPQIDSLLSLSIDNLSYFLEDLIVLLGRELAGASVEIRLFFPNAIFLFDLAQRGFFSWGDIKEDNAGQCWIPLDIAGNKISLSCSVIPEHGWRIGRITYDGFYLAHAHFLQTQQYSQYAVGNIKDGSILELYEKGKGYGSLFYDLVKSRQEHQCQSKPCWESCFGGWNGSEINMLTNHSLNEKIIYCKK